MAKNKKLFIDMCAGSELKDTQGETLSVEGADISDLQAGKGRFNDNHGKGFFNSLGRVTQAKKIFKAEDCDNERHSYYWDKIKAPYIYVAGELYNDEDHPNAKAAAAILRNIHREDTPLKMKASVEGGVLSRGIKDPTRLARTKIHSVALTFTPANNATLVEPLNIDKSSTDWEADRQLIKSVEHLAETNIPSFRHIERHASASTIYENISKIQELAKSIGVNIQIDLPDTDTIMRKAVLSKLATNVNKINELVKAANNYKTAMTPGYLSPGKTQMAAEEKKAEKMKVQDQYQQDIGKLKADPTTPKKPKDIGPKSTKDISQVKGAGQHKAETTLKIHASKAMRDPKHLESLHESLSTNPKVGSDKAKVIISKIKQHMDLSKSEDLEKKAALRNLAIAATLATGAHQMGPKDADKPKEVKVKEVEADKKNAKIKDPDKMVSPKGYDERQPNAKAKFRARREKLKGKLKKALIAGYGGAGAPTSLTSGGVFQEESLEGSKKAETTDGFSYISCDDCGHEQVYMKHQVKCRKCRSNFNLNKLENHI